MRPVSTRIERIERVIRRLLSREDVEMVSAIISAVISAICAPFLTPFFVSFLATSVPMLFSSFAELLLTSFGEGTLVEFVPTL